MIETRRALLICLSFVALSFFLTPPASADPIEDAGEVVGDPISDVVGDPISDAVGQTTDPVTGTVDGPVDSATGAVDGAVDGATGTAGGAVDAGTGTVDGAVETVTDTVTSTVDPVTNNVEDTIEDVTGPIEDVVDSVTDAVEDAVDTVTDTVDDTTDQVTDAVDDTAETVDGVVGPQPEGSETDPSEGRGPDVQAPGAPDGATEAETSEPVNPPSGSGRPHDGDVTRSTGQQGALPSQRDGGDGRNRSTTDPLSQRGLGPDVPVIRPTSLADRTAADRDPDGSGSILRRLGEAARHPAFPLLLALVVMGYVALQNRLDGNDPKLAAATLETEQDLLHFK